MDHSIRSAIEIKGVISSRPIEGDQGIVHSAGAYNILKIGWPGDGQGEGTTRCILFNRYIKIVLVGRCRRIAIFTGNEQEYGRGQGDPRHF